MSIRYLDSMHVHVLIKWTRWSGSHLRCTDLLQKRALYKNKHVRKNPNLKGKIFGFFLY